MTRRRSETSSTYLLICAGSERRPGGALALSFPVSCSCLRCLLFQVMKTERLTETFSCCFPDPGDMPAPPATLVRARGEV